MKTQTDRQDVRRTQPDEEPTPNSAAEQAARVNARHPHAPDGQNQGGRAPEDEVQEASQESFPASDPPGWTPQRT